MMQGLEYLPLLQAAAVSNAGEICVPASIATAVGGLITALLGANAVQWKAAQKRNERDWESAKELEAQLHQITSRLLDQEEARRVG